MWSTISVSFIGSFWKPWHFVPLVNLPDMQDNPISLDDFDQFPPLNQNMEKTSTPTKSDLSVSPTDFKTTIAFSDITEPVLKATITSFIQDNELEVSILALTLRS